MTRRVAVAAPNAAAADAAAAIAGAGGNAVDAAIAASLVTMVNEVGIVSLSSGGFATVQPAGGSAPVTVDGWMDMPGRRTADQPRIQPGQGTWDVETEYGGGVTITVGPGSVATHGAIAAFEETHRRWGSVPWRELVGPAIDVARGGFVLGSASRYYLQYVRDSIFGWDEGSRTALHDPETGLRDGSLVVPDLADTLEHVAEAGPRTMYEGDLARAISDDVLVRGGLLSRADLAGYEPVVRPSLRVEVGPWTLGTNPPPAVGGAVVAAMLRLMNGRGLDDRGHLVAVQRRVLGERLRVFDHSDDLARDAAAFLDLIDRDGLAVLESGSTAHVSATDTDGNACAITVSSGYGSGMIAAGTGIWLNNCLGEPELNPRGLHGLEPGTRLLSNMAPTVGHDRDGASLAIGSPGADRITTAIAQVIAGFLSGLDLQAATDHPRLHLHRAGCPDEELKVEHEPTMYFGGVGATLRDREGRLHAAADPRREGATRIVTAQ
ncbi:gamma-glutamyltransferase [Aeromicrobium phragmitis]|uniref:Gamma-glutamyltransferase n=1 Tax=Aeromicrobium phragmitis TaxID=2478914 RepID=A0A3L8PJ68_9ACTN|nr:gamma-glutamyltransferase [Aeromicrobium phragmitis]RLV54608.1 gamma-glutamyltransferase [Aeromicrobium phragmitis]